MCGHLSVRHLICRSDAFSFYVILEQLPLHRLRLKSDFRAERGSQRLSLCSHSAPTLQAPLHKPAITPAAFRASNKLGALFSRTRRVFEVWAREDQPRQSRGRAEAKSRGQAVCWRRARKEKQFGRRTRTHALTHLRCARSSDPRVVFLAAGGIQVANSITLMFARYRKRENVDEFSL